MLSVVRDTEHPPAWAGPGVHRWRIEPMFPISRLSGIKPFFPMFSPRGTHVWGSGRQLVGPRRFTERRENLKFWRNDWTRGAKRQKIAIFFGFTLFDDESFDQFPVAARVSFSARSGRIPKNTRSPHDCMPRNRDPIQNITTPDVVSYELFLSFVFLCS